MTIFRRAPAGLVASGVFVLGLFYAAGAVTHAAPVTNEVMLVNAKTGKCADDRRGHEHRQQRRHPCSSTATTIRRAAGC